MPIRASNSSSPEERLGFFIKGGFRLSSGAKIISFRYRGKQNTQVVFYLSRSLPQPVSRMAVTTQYKTPTVQYTRLSEPESRGHTCTVLRCKADSELYENFSKNVRSLDDRGRHGQPAITRAGNERRIKFVAHRTLATSATSVAGAIPTAALIST